MLVCPCVVCFYVCECVCLFWDSNLGICCDGLSSLPPLSSLFCTRRLPAINVRVCIRCRTFHPPHGHATRHCRLGGTSPRHPFHAHYTARSVAWQQVEPTLSCHKSVGPSFKYICKSGVRSNVGGVRVKAAWDVHMSSLLPSIVVRSFGETTIGRSAG